MNSHRVRWTPTDAVLVLLGAQLLSILWASAVLDVAYGGGTLPSPLPIKVGVIANVGLWLGYGLGPIIVARAKGRGPVDDYGLRLKPSDVPLGLAFGAVVQLLVLPLLYWPLLRFVDGDPGEAARELVENLDGRLDWLVFALSVAVIAPVVEELFYRGLLLRSLQSRFGAVIAVVVSSLVFAAVHRQLLPFPGLFLFGAIAAIVTLRTGRLGPAIALHMGFNAATLIALGLTV